MCWFKFENISCSSLGSVKNPGELSFGAPHQNQYFSLWKYTMKPFLLHCLAVTCVCLCLECMCDQKVKVHVAFHHRQSPVARPQCIQLFSGLHMVNILKKKIVAPPGSVPFYNINKHYQHWFVVCHLNVSPWRSKDTPDEPYKPTSTTKKIKKNL